MQLLRKGLSTIYTINRKKNWLEAVALEAKTALSKLNIMEQQCYRYIFAKTIKN
jgi:hypothetical protein